ncbi:electron transport complex subunit RsxD [Pragia fontium]|uniref:Ion-translocating oxidoreductase complex subunit D n=1 Tax=Pragia fontium DSM 5563 = ATCC 49100 TaxID=1122977 RepID=A0AAJ5BHH9_9GAMM|nr:electron transport complex subunit RsxD [Pragia fontium]AKJ42241.1 electron transporter RnfD [Pragia fontium]SFC96250.1 electron transport complex protein RnfD [Pragia fontium DSM 5563 = ATCC 49100]VEJ55411.1 Na(+)-translocating NADH-quinone reductase subunit B [Pragia fontium]
MSFRITSSPFSHSQQSTQRLMLLVVLACLPGIAAQWYFFGYGNLIQIALAIIVALLSEGLVLKLRHIPVIPRLADNSALLTALLLGISIPPLAPWWIIVIGTFSAIVIAKQLYGGLGQNPFNPAMVGYVILLISFPIQMSSWLPPEPLQATHIGFIDTLSIIFTGHSQSGDDVFKLMLGIDGVSQATPLDTLKTGLRSGHTMAEILSQPIYDSLAGIGWQWVNAGFLLGGLYLLWKKVIQWHLSLSFLLTLTIISTLGWLLDPTHNTAPWFHLFSGATMLCAFFIITDPVTASTTAKGRIIFGALVAVLVWLIRSYGGYPDGVAFAILLANITVPLIDHYTQPRVYGHR